MNKIKKPPLFVTRLLAVALMLFALFLQAEPAHAAAQITNRSLTLMEGANDLNGGSLHGAVVKHKFQFDVPSSTNVGSIKLLYCTTAAGSCTMPEGLVTTSATLGDNSTGNITGLALTNTTNGSPYLHRTAAAVTPGTVNFRIDGITNPDVVTPSPQPNYTFFVRISTYTSIDTTGTAIDAGTVAASTTQRIQLTGTMPESLVFCTGANIDTNPSGGVGTPGGGVPDCSTATSGDITFSPQLFSPTSTSTATSQMAASTNAGTGYVITVNGTTLTSGGNFISGVPSPGSTSAIGTSQFGMNLVANTTPVAFGLNIDDASDNSLLRGMPQPDYNTANTYTYVDGAAVAKSDHLTPGSPAGYAPAPLPTNAQIYTASYIVNVPGSQAAGDYTATLTYICTPTF